MRRILLVLTVALVMAAMMAVTATSAFAKPVEIRICNDLNPDFRGANVFTPGAGWVGRCSQPGQPG